eukprot:343839_1
MYHFVRITLVIALVQVLCSQYDTICIWGRQGDNTEINGEYTAYGTLNDKTHYQKTVHGIAAPGGCMQMHLYWATGQGVDAWLIHYNTDMYNSYAYCPSPLLMNCTAWLVEEYSAPNTTFNDSNTYRFVLDSSVSVLNGSCPIHIWQCDQVHIPSLPFPCNTVFDTPLDDNIWTDSTNSYYWHWNEWDFRWECSEMRPNVSACDNTYTRVRTERGWNYIAPGTSTALPFAHPFGDYTVDCIQNTMDPTVVTAKPTDAPSSATPTAYPTKNPSEAPNHLLFAREPSADIAIDSEVEETTTTATTTGTIQPEQNDKDDETPLAIVILIIGVVVIGVCGVVRYGCYCKRGVDQSDQSQQIISEWMEEDAEAERVEKAQPKPIELEVPVRRERVHSESQYAQDERTDMASDIEPGSAPQTKVLNLVTEGADDDRYEARNKKARQLLQEWLTNRVGLPQYYQILVDNGYETLEIVKEITEEEQLREIGIELKGHVKKLRNSNTICSELIALKHM